MCVHMRMFSWLQTRGSVGAVLSHLLTAQGGWLPLVCQPDHGPPVLQSVTDLPNRLCFLIVQVRKP